jgi:hypothetical protein
MDMTNEELTPEEIIGQILGLNDYSALPSIGPQSVEEARGTANRGTASSHVRSGIELKKRATEAAIGGLESALLNTEPISTVVATVEEVIEDISLVQEARALGTPTAGTAALLVGQTIGVNQLWETKTGEDRKGRTLTDVARVQRAIVGVTRLLRAVSLLEGGMRLGRGVRVPGSLRSAGTEAEAQVPVKFPKDSAPAPNKKPLAASKVPAAKRPTAPHTVPLNTIEKPGAKTIEPDVKALKDAINRDIRATNSIRSLPAAERNAQRGLATAKPKSAGPRAKENKPAKVTAKPSVGSPKKAVTAPAKSTGSKGTGGAATPGKSTSSPATGRNIKGAANQVLGADQYRGGQTVLLAEVKMPNGEVRKVAMPNSPETGGSGWRDLQRDTARNLGYEPIEPSLPGSGLHAEENMNLWLRTKKAVITKWAIGRGKGGTSTVCTSQACRTITQGWPPQEK